MSKWPLQHGILVNGVDALLESRPALTCLILVNVLLQVPVILGVHEEQESVVTVPEFILSRDRRRLQDEQASNNDYENSRYERGHLYPVCHAPDQVAAKSTFALTNAAPQKCDFNKVWYHRVENRVRETLKKCPQNSAYIVTGVVPSGAETLKDEGRVNVPSHFWTAYYGGNNCPFGGYIMGKEDDETKYDDERTFQEALSALYKRNVQVFSAKRPRTS
ncbi:hypothetical protein AOLI_G00189670 [Acnodon oligacanthus]